MKTVKKLILAAAIFIALTVPFSVFASGEVLYENSFSESGGWVWESVGTGTSGFGTDGAYATGISGQKVQLVARTGDVPLNFFFMEGETYEISFLSKTASAAEHRLNFNTGSNTVYIRTEDGRDAALGEGMNSSVSWWGDDICNIGQMQSGKKPAWQSVSMRFTVSKVVSSIGESVSGSAIQWMTFSVPYANEKEIGIKDFSIKKIPGIKTVKTIANSSNAAANQTPGRLQTVFSKTKITSVDGFSGGGGLKGPRRSFGFVGFNAPSGAYLDVPSSGFMIKKGHTYRLNYFIKRGTGVSGVTVSNSFITNGGEIVVLEEGDGSKVTTLSNSGRKPNSEWDNGDGYFTVKDIKNGENSVDSAAVDFIRFDFDAVEGSVYEFYFADLTVSEFSNFIEISKTVAGNGSVTVNSSDASAVETEQYGELNIEITPDSGSRIKSAVLGETDIKSLIADCDKGGAVKLYGIGASKTLNVEFEELPVVPGFDGAVSVMKSASYTFKDYTGPSFVSYAKLNNYAYGDDSEFGFQVSDPVSGNSVLLKAEGKTASGSFGVRIIGAAISADTDYTFRPYMIIDGETTYGDEAHAE
ncbi:MAG: hypothetical protein SOW78_08965 [Clostridia bacterium]|nr:hypothetical protein [Clostridia bacterium]